MLQVLVADDHAIVRLAIRSVLEALPGVSLCGLASDGEEALALALRESPDVAILDVSMPLLDGIAVARRLRHERATAKVLLFTLHDDEQTIDSALAAGVRGYVLKSDAGEELGRAVSALGANRTYFSPVVADLLLDHAFRRPGEGWGMRFTEREIQVAELVAAGRSNKDIARRLEISPKTVETHRGSFMQKANCHSSPEMVRFAIKNGLIRS